MSDEAKDPQDEQKKNDSGQRIADSDQQTEDKGQKEESGEKKAEEEGRKTEEQAPKEDTKEEGPPAEETVAQETPTTAAQPQGPPVLKNIFYVESQKSSLRRACNEFLDEIGVAPLKLNSDDPQWHSIEDQVKQHPEIPIAVVLLSGDEFVYHKDSKPAESSLRASQDVIFLLGFLISHLGKNHVFVLYHEQKSFRLPVAVNHVMFTPCDQHGFWKDAFRKRMKLLDILLPGGNAQENG